MKKAKGISKLHRGSNRKMEEFLDPENVDNIIRQQVKGLLSWEAIELNSSLMTSSPSRITYFSSIMLLEVSAL